MDRLEGRWALITGASSGFGVHFATVLAAHSVNLILVARRKEPMDALAETLRRTTGVRVIVEPADLSVRGAAADIKQRIDGHRIDVDVLINNAGQGLYGDFLDQRLLGESLRAELKKHNVNVTVLSPGPAQTSFAQVAGQRDTFVVKALMMEPQPVVTAGIHAMLQRRSSVVAGLPNQLIIFSNRLMPRFVQRLIMQRVLSGETEHDRRESG